jgi:hypothetical protein
VQYHFLLFNDILVFVKQRYRSRSSVLAVVFVFLFLLSICSQP